MRPTVNRHVALWTLQVFLAVFFVLASGAPKLMLPTSALPMPIVLPDWFVRAIGVAEVLGGIGLILPGLPAVRRLAAALNIPAPAGLTPLAAVGLVLLTVCATTYQMLAQQPGNALFALGMGVLCATVAVGRGWLTTARPPAGAYVAA